jgi:integrase/recombinase XerD
MKQNNAIAAIHPDKRRVKNDGLIPIKVRITFKGSRKYYATGYDVDLANWNLIRENKARGELKKTSTALFEIQVNAQKCCDTIENFSFLKFENAFFPKIAPIADLKTAYQSYIKMLSVNGQIGTAESYHCATVSLHKFKANLKLEDITPEFLREYEKWFVGNGKSITTVGIYLRSLRAILNLAIENGLIDRTSYPFGKRKYIIPTGKNIKKAMSLSEIAKIYNHKVEKGSVAEMCRDYWIFIYLCNGLNVKDLCLLKYKNIENDFITFYRAKTIRSRRVNPEPIRVALKEDAKRIIAKWGQLKINADSYIFPHLKFGMTLLEQMNTVKRVTHLINDYMKIIAKKVEIDKPVTTYYARHSFATILKNSGVSTEFICEALGHTSLATTKNYLAGFERGALEQTTNVLLSFKNELIT